MAIITNLPPQAYTRDTLVKAIEWLSSQPTIVRERANSADLIVSYYLQASRRAAIQRENNPVSGENFKTDLKHLAEDLKQFSVDTLAPQSPPLPPPAMSNTVFGRNFSSPPHAFEAENEPEIPIFRPDPPPHAPRSANPSAKNASSGLDARSISAAREVQQRFNLSSQQEAVRLLIQLGSERLRELFS